MELGFGDEILDLGKGPDSQIQPLVPVQRSMVKDQEPITQVFVLVAGREDGSVWNIENHGTSAWVDGSGQKPLLPSVIRNDQMARKPGTETFGPAEETETK